jgi:anti-sigma factor ChrR (cupin superfamily)
MLSCHGAVQLATTRLEKRRSFHGHLQSKYSHSRRLPGVHKKAAEVLCILDGDFINENKAYGSGDFLHSKPGTVHGPHTTKKAVQF